MALTEPFKVLQLWLWWNPSWFGFKAIGGYSELETRFLTAIPEKSTNSVCGIPSPDAFHAFRGLKSDFPWIGATFGLSISSVWYWCADQVIVQRALAAKNITHAKAGTVLAGWLKFLPLWLIVFPGMIARILFPDVVGCSDPDVCFKECGSRSGCTNIAYPKLVLEVMPNALRGLMMAVMMSALISSLTSIFNSSSTIFTMDIWRRIRKNASEIELLIVGRCCVLVLVGVGIAWIPVVQNVSELFHYIQAVTSYLAPPVCAVYVLAVFWKRINEQGAFWGLMVGLVVGLIRFGWEYAYTVPPCGSTTPDPRPSIIKDVHYLHFGIILFGVVVIATTIISLLTAPIDEVHLYRLTFWTRHSKAERIDITVDEGLGSQEKPEHGSTGERQESCIRKVGNWICGIEKLVDGDVMSEEEKAAIEAKQLNINEKPFWKTFCNVNAVLLMSIAVFFWGFFA